MPITTNEYNAASKGGTELSIAELTDYVDPELIAKVEIIPGRFREFKTDLPKILWLHDLPDDPEMNHLANEGWKKFHKIVFVSNWQMQQFINKFRIPWNRCEYISNAIRPLNMPPRRFDETLNFIYHTTPHRGLHILTAAFSELAKKHNDIRLDVYSSFSIYGWADRDIPYKPIYEMIEAHPNMHYHGAKPNDIVREALVKTHIFAYPSIWPETGCRALIEAMCAGLVCVHSNYGCLYETGRMLTSMYQFRENQSNHAQVLYTVLDELVDSLRSTDAKLMDDYQKSRSALANAYYSWDIKKDNWNDLIKNLVR
jgi:UDP-glucose:(glucosyl)LPS alpha-1,2-glucosyltransferase